MSCQASQGAAYLGSCDIKVALVVFQGEEREPRAGGTRLTRLERKETVSVDCLWEEPSRLLTFSSRPST